MAYIRGACTRVAYARRAYIRRAFCVSIFKTLKSHIISIKYQHCRQKRASFQLKPPSFCFKTYLELFYYLFYLVVIDIFTCRKSFYGLNLQYVTYLITRGLMFGGAYIRDFTVWLMGNSAYYLSLLLIFEHIWLSSKDEKTLTDWPIKNRS